MTTATRILSHDKKLIGFCLTDHANYAQEGNDIVCAAISVLYTTCANAIESITGVEAVTLSEGDTNTVLLPTTLTSAQKQQADIIMKTILQGFTDIAEAYPRNFSLQ